MAELLELKNISKTYDGRNYILDGLDFCLKTGEIATVFGASGCGKSTFLNIVGLLDSCSDGTYLFDGQQINPRRLNAYSHIRSGAIGFVFQSYCLIEALSVRDNIWMPFLYHGAPMNHEAEEYMDVLLEKFQIAGLKDKKVSLLSGGERQRVAMIRAMLKKPKLVIADEPTGNLDERNAEIAVSAFRESAAEGAAVLIVTHNRHLNFGAGNVYTMEGGKLHQ